MQIITTFIYLITGAWFVYYIGAMGWLLLNGHRSFTFSGLAISVILGSASLALYLGGA